MLRFQDRGDVAAFDELFRRHKDAFVSFLANLAGDRVVAEDVSQQVWLKLIDVAHRGGYQRRARFRTYLYTIGRNTFLDEYRRKHANTRSDPLDERDYVDGDEAATAEGGALALRRRDVLARALSGLPVEQREVLALWAAGHSIETMTEVTGAPRDTVLSRRKYGLRKLRAALVEAGIEQGDL